LRRLVSSSATRVGWYSIDGNSSSQRIVPNLVPALGFTVARLESARLLVMGGDLGRARGGAIIQQPAMLAGLRARAEKSTDYHPALACVRRVQY
jgi:hypothetical protein